LPPKVISARGDADTDQAKKYIPDHN